MKTGGSALFAAGATAAALVGPAIGARGSSGDRYLVTLTGSQQTRVTRTGSIEDELGCTFDVKDADRQALTFSATQRVRLALGPGGAVPRIGFAARVTAAGSRHRESELSGGDPAVCDPGQPPQTKRCDKRVLRGRVSLRPRGPNRVVLDGALARGADRLACATTLTKPDRFLVPSESRLVLPPRGAPRSFAKGRLHLTTRGPEGIAKTTDVRWTVVLRRL